ncbi:MAG: flagellar protein FlgN [Nitrospirota bacterium]|nr:flagellar protein FlgN [Nitrospirota bacterium]MDE3241104.1 flagellar protein FlgN [Nitrospirota bacterium]
MLDTSTTTHRLSELLEREQRCIDDLGAVLHQEQDALRTLSNDGLAGTNQRKLALLEEIRSLEGERISLVEQLALGWAMPSESLTLTAIAGRAGAEDAGRLLWLQERLSRSVETLRAANRMSGVLVAGSLLLIQNILSLWTRNIAAPPVYSSSGALQAKASGTFLARKG